MKISIDGLRRGLTKSLNELSCAVQDLIAENEIRVHIDSDVINEVIDNFNDTATFIGTFNCTFDDEIEDDFNDLSEKLTIDFIEDVD